MFAAHLKIGPIISPLISKFVRETTKNYKREAAVFVFVFKRETNFLFQIESNFGFV